MIHWVKLNAGEYTSEEFLKSAETGTPIPVFSIYKEDSKHWFLFQYGRLVRKALRTLAAAKEEAQKIEDDLIAKGEDYHRINSVEKSAG